MSPAPARYSDSGQRIWPRLSPSGECMVWTGARTSTGYGSMTVDGKRWKSHRYAYTLTFGPIPAGMDVLHSCDNPPCCNPAHLSIGNASENARQMVSRGRHGGGYGESGEAHHQAKLTAEEVIAIRSSPATEKATADRYGVSASTVHAIRHRKIWRNL